MALAFENTPADLLLPLFYAEITSAPEPASPSLVLCLIGHMNKPLSSPGTGVPNYPYLITNQSQADATFGRGSQLAGMYQAARRNSRWTEIWCTGIAEDVAATVATATITCAAPTVANSGVMTFWVGGSEVKVLVKSTMTATTLAQAINAKINSLGLYMKSTVSGGVCTLLCRWGGVSGNEIRISMSGPHGRRSALWADVRLSYKLLTITQPSGGAGDTHPQECFPFLTNRRYDIFAYPYTSADTLDAAELFMDASGGRWSPGTQKYGHMVTARFGSLAGLVTQGDARNDPHMTILGAKNSIQPAWEWSSALAAIMASHWSAPPELSRPLQTLKLRGMYVGSDDDESFTAEERELLLKSGISTFHVEDDTSCIIDRIRTLRKTNAYGDPDPSWADAITLFQAMYFVKSMRAAITGAFPRAALTTEPSGIPGFASPPLIKIVVMQEYKRLQSIGLVENYDLFVQYLVVERDPVDRNRVNIMMRPDVVNQLRIVATIIETHLELSPNDPLAAISLAA